MTHLAAVSRIQLAVLVSLHSLNGCATVADIGTQLEATTRYTRLTGTYTVEELVALGHCWQEGNMVGLTADMCAYLEANEYV